MIIRKGSVAPVTGSSYPEGFDALGDYLAFPLSDAGGLTQFGAFTERLMPGARSSQRHWHEEEDEFLYVLEGELTVIEEDGEHRLVAGDAACWPRGVANGHCLRNDGAAPAFYLIVGTRAAEDEAHYPDIDLHYRRRGGERGFQDKQGRWYPGWPKESKR